jgi:hypothetical protein
VSRWGRCPTSLVGRLWLFVGGCNLYSFGVMVGDGRAWVCYSLFMDLDRGQPWSFMGGRACFVLWWGGQLLFEGGLRVVGMGFENA